MYLNIFGYPQKITYRKIFLIENKENFPVGLVSQDGYFDTLRIELTGNKQVTTGGLHVRRSEESL